MLSMPEQLTVEGYVGCQCLHCALVLNQPFIALCLILNLYMLLFLSEICEMTSCHAMYVGFLSFPIMTISHLSS